MLISVDNFKELRKRHANDTIVLTSGTFDIIHVGHVRYLEKAARLGDLLIVMTGSDRRVRIRKGNRRPIMPVEDRIAILLALKVVDYVIIDPTDENPGIGHPVYVELIRRLDPGIYATDQYDPRFVDIVDPARQVILEREPGGTFASTSELITYIASLEG